MLIQLQDQYSRLNESLYKDIENLHLNAAEAQEMLVTNKNNIRNLLIEK